MSSNSNPNPGSVTIVEVSPRDGLQNIPFPIPTATKIELIERLSRTGLTTIEISSVVSSKAVPQLADWREVVGSEVVKQLKLRDGDEVGEEEGDDHEGSDGDVGSRGSSCSLDSSSISDSSSSSSSSSYSQPSPEPQTKRSGRGIRFPVLIPNLRGLHLLQTPSPSPSPNSISVFVSATSPFSHANTNCSVSEGLSRSRAVASAFKKSKSRSGSGSGGGWVRAYISCIFRDPITRERTPHEDVLDCVRSLLSASPEEEGEIDSIVLSDTDGSGTPALVSSLLSHLISHCIPLSKLAVHFHDTHHRGLSNVWAAYVSGVRVFDGSVAGLGGCPFAPGAKGNVDSVSMVRMFRDRGVETGVDGGELGQVGEWVRGAIGRLEEGYRQGEEKRDAGFWDGKEKGLSKASLSTVEAKNRSGPCWSALTRPMMFEQ